MKKAEVVFGGLKVWILGHLSSFSVTPELSGGSLRGVILYLFCGASWWRAIGWEVKVFSASSDSHLQSLLTKEDVSGCSGPVDGIEEGACLCKADQVGGLHKYSWSNETHNVLCFWCLSIVRVVGLENTSASSWSHCGLKGGPNGSFWNAPDLSVFPIPKFIMSSPKPTQLKDSRSLGKVFFLISFKQDQSGAEDKRDLVLPVVGNNSNKCLIIAKRHRS